MKIEEFINLRQGTLSVEEYSLKFTLLSEYDPSLVSKHGDDMTRLFIIVSDIVKEECRTSMLYDIISLPRLIVYSQSI